MPLTAPRDRTPLDSVAEFIATGFGTGRGPIAPATWGTAAALAIYWALGRALDIGGDSAWYFILTAAVIVIGTAAAERLSVPGDEDPRRVVIDEWAGALVTVAFLDNSFWWLFAGFWVFRVLDVAKPGPVRRLEKLHGGIGIMADDIAAGIIGAIGLNIVRLIFFN